MKIVSPFDAHELTLPLLTGLGGALALALFAMYSAATAKPPPRKHKDGKETKVHILDGRKPLLGDLPEMARNAERMNYWIAETTLRYNGEPWRIYLPGMMNILVVTTPELIEEVMATQFDNFIRGEAAIQQVEDLFGRSFVTSDGERWFHQRKAVAKFFTARSLRTCMVTNMRKNMAQVCDVVDRSIAEQTTLDMHTLFQQFAMQTFVQVGLGIDMNVIGTRDLHELEHAVEEANPAVMRRGSLPVWYWKLERWLNVGPERKVKAAMDVVYSWLKSAMAKRQQERAEAKEKGITLPDEEIKSLVELFLEQSSEDEDGLHLDDLPDLVLSFVLAARGTSATALLWIVLVVAKHPEVERRIREEFAAVLGDLGDNEYVTTDHISKLVYLEATIREVLRLYPTIPMNQRVAAVDTVIGHSIQVKKGDVFFINPYTTARLPSVWGDDAAEFRPQRWIDDETGELLSFPPSKFNTFSAGPRSCIGMRLAMLELRIVAANLFKRYTFSLARPNDLRHSVSIELMPTDPVVFKVEHVTTAA
jgi:cytochrome P450